MRANPRGEALRNGVKKSYLEAYHRFLKIAEIYFPCGKLFLSIKGLLMGKYLTGL